ncbi:hypothetical protein AgCh_028701 [Apium graveolens]
MGFQDELEVAVFELKSSKTTISELKQEKQDLKLSLDKKIEDSVKLESYVASMKESLKCLHDNFLVEIGLKEKLECTVLEITSQLDEVQDKLRCFESLDAKMVNLRQFPSNLDIKRSQNNLSVQHKDCQEESSRPTGLSCQLAEIHEHVLAAEEEKEKLELSLYECVEEKSIITAELALRKEHLENSLTSIDIQDEVAVDTIKSISSNEEIRVKTEMQIYKNQRDAEIEQANAELATKKAVWSQFSKMAQVEADKGSTTRNSICRHAQGSVGEGGGKEAVLYDKIRESVARSRVRRQEEITELRKRGDEFLCMFNEVQNESKDRLKEIEESQLKLAQLQTTLERLELNVSNLESENQGFRASLMGREISSGYSGIEGKPNTQLEMEAKYTALLFKQHLTACIEKIYGLIRDSLKKEIIPFLNLCIQSVHVAVKQDQDGM